MSKFFNPESVAIVGVPRTDYRFGGLSYLNRFQDSGFPGRLYPINPKADEINGLKAYPSLTALPEAPDLAIVCVAARIVPAILEECGRLGLRHIHILSSGFGEVGTPEGRALEDRLAEVAREHDLLVIGPNCMGPYSPSARLTAWGAIPGMPGPLGIISQSGGITQRLTEYAWRLGLGVDKAVSFGNGAVLSASDFLEYMAEDDRIRAICMYLESVPDGPAFLRLAARVNRDKPIILFKGGLSEAGASTAASHTGGLAGRVGLWSAFFAQTGVTQVTSMDEWLDAALAFCFLPPPAGKGVFVVGGGGGNSVAYADTFVREGLAVPRLSEKTMAWLKETVPAAGNIAGNPLDMWQTFMDPAYLIETLERGYQDPAVGMIVVDRLIPRMAFHMPDLPDPNPAVVEHLKKNGRPKPTAFMVDSEGGDPELAAAGASLRALYGGAGVPAFPSAARAARAMGHLYRYYARFGRNRTE